jgi:hypothetical protein
MLGVLQIALRHDAVALRVRIARELEVLLIDVRSGAADLDLWAIGIVGAVRVQIAAVVVTAATAATAAVVAATVCRRPTTASA